VRLEAGRLISVGGVRFQAGSLSTKKVDGAAWWSSHATLETARRLLTTSTSTSMLKDSSIIQTNITPE